MDVGIDTEKTNPFDTGGSNPGAEEDIELHPMTSSRRGSVDPTDHHRTYEETSFGGDISDTTDIIEKERKRDDTWERIKEKYPKINPLKASFTATIDKFNRVVVKLNRTGGKYHPLFSSDGEVSNKLPKSITDNLGESAENIFETNELRRNCKT